jgi:type I restriction enzyme M protein
LNHQSLSNFIWSVADLLRGDYKQSEYGRVILPYTVLRRLDCVLAPTKKAVLKEAEAGRPDPFLIRAAQRQFFNRSSLDLGKLIGDQDNIGTNLLAYIQGFSSEVRDIFEQFEFAAQIDRLAKNGLLYQVTERFAGIDLHPDRVDNAQMGLAFEELGTSIYRWSNVGCDDSLPSDDGSDGCGNRGFLGYLLT